MNSNKSLFILVALVIVGSTLVSFISINSGLAFGLGAIAATLVLKYVPAAEPSSEAETLPEVKDENNTTLYVGNLSYKASENHVKDLFAEYGTVNSVRLMKDKRTGKRRGFGFVEVASDDADAMISALNEHEYMQRTIKVRVANDPKHPPAAES